MGLAGFGHSRDGKARDRQVQVGLVMINGWPNAHHVINGSLRDCQTLGGVLKDLEKRFGLGRVIFVGDRGTVTIQNLALLRQRGQGYLVGLKSVSRFNMVTRSVPPSSVRTASGSSPLPTTIQHASGTRSLASRSVSRSTKIAS